MLKEKKNPNLSAQYFGFIAVIDNGKIIIKKVEPNSISEKNKIVPEDEIIRVNNKEIKGQLADILKKCKKKVSFTVKNNFDEKEIYPYVTEGIGEDILPKNVDFDLIDAFEKVTDEDAALYLSLIHI